VPVDVGSVFGVDAGTLNAPLITGYQDTASKDPFGSPFTVKQPVVGTVLEAVKAWYNLSSADRVEWANHLEAAGYLSSNVDSKGRVTRRNPKTVESAYHTAVLDAARSGMTVHDLIVQAEGEATASGATGGGATVAPFNAQVSNPLDIRAGLKAAATKVLGGALPEAKINELISEFQQQQVGAQRSLYDTNQTGGTAVAAPDLGTFAQSRVRAIDPVKADSRSAVKVASVIAQMLAGHMAGQQLPGEGG
jgi:hypothetical protein